MPINYLPNDPLSQAFAPIRQVDPHPDRPTNRAKLRYTGKADEDLYEIGSKEYLFWQCRESALRAISMWEGLDGPLNRWQGNRRNLSLRQDIGSRLNAFYDRNSLSFFHHTSGQKTTFSGASTDVVAHEAGHAFLDAIRPQLWDASFPETGAFHEAFGDIVAIVTALMDRDIRFAILIDSPDLRSANFVDATTEDLADGVRRALGTQHPAAKPRRALNDYSWEHPMLLPINAPPDELSSEIHSFGRVFSGCFYDMLSNIFNARPSRNDQALLEATQISGRLLIEAAKSAPIERRYFQSIGRAMVLADQTQNGGANHLSIRDAFSRHNVALGSSAMLAPTSVLAGAAPTVSKKSKKLTMVKAVGSDLAKRIGLKSSTVFAVNAVRLGRELVAEAVHKHEIGLGKIDKRLKGVIASAPVSTLVGAVGQRAAVLGALPDLFGVEDEVFQFVEMLLKNDCIRFEGAEAEVSSDPNRLETHEIQELGSKKVLHRTAFVCSTCLL